MAPAAKGGKKKGRSAIGEVVTREYTVHIHKCIHGVGFQERAPWVLREMRKLAMKEDGNPRCPHRHQVQQDHLGPRSRKAPYGTQVQLSRKCNEEEDSPEKRCTLVMCALCLSPLFDVYIQLM
ncbi:large ribosomal subunit protein eL31-like [Glossophaga mutica]